MAIGEVADGVDANYRVERRSLKFQFSGRIRHDEFGSMRQSTLARQLFGGRNRL
jgi:hypothetical protein